MKLKFIRLVGEKALFKDEDQSNTTLILSKEGVQKGIDKLSSEGKDTSSLYQALRQMN